MKDLKKLAIDALEYNTHLDEVFVSSDGAVFQSKNDAVNHAVKLEDKNVSVFKRDIDQDNDSVSETVLAAKDVIKLIEEAGSEEAVNTVVGADDRKTVVAAQAKRIAELKQLAINQQSANADKAQENRKND